MAQIILIRPGSTDYDHQARIQGNLNIPLSEAGQRQAAETAELLGKYQPTAVYCSPNSSAEQTAEIIAERLDLKPKTIERLANVNLGLWQGMLVEEVRLKQPKVYKQWQEHPETIQPPDGEMLADATERAMEGVEKLAKKHRSATMVLVVSEPLASLIQHRIQGVQWSDLWRAANGCNRVEVMTLGKDGAKTASPEAVNGSANGRPENAAPAADVKKANGQSAPTTAGSNGKYPLIYRGAKIEHP